MRSLEVVVAFMLDDGIHRGMKAQPNLVDAVWWVLHILVLYPLDNAGFVVQGIIPELRIQRSKKTKIVDV